MLKKITKAGNLFIRIVTGVFAAVFLIYALFTLWDMYRTDIRAFASYDLLKYRPNIEEDEPPYLDELVKINPDTAAWVTIYGTNIDYPVMQGKTDTEYINKTATGGYSISGSIFLSILNKKNFSDPYCLLYGHHMQNGSMFGDIKKFKNKRFFMNTGDCRFKEDEGVLIMENKVYNLKVFAYIDTDAYDYDVYRSDKSRAEMQESVANLMKRATHVRDVGKIDKVLALSTCHDATTAGRSVLLCKMKLRTDPLPTREAEPLTPHRKAVGHPMAGAYWSLMNLFIMVLCLYAAYPVHLLFARWRKNKKDPYVDPFDDIYENDDLSSVGKAAERRSQHNREVIIMAFAAIASFLLFYVTEDPHKPMQVADRFTPVMLLLLVTVWYMRCRIEGMEEIIPFWNRKNTAGSEKRK